MCRSTSKQFKELSEKFVEIGIVSYNSFSGYADSEGRYNSGPIFERAVYLIPYLEIALSFYCTAINKSSIAVQINFVKHTIELYTIDHITEGYPV